MLEFLNIKLGNGNDQFSLFYVYFTDFQTNEFTL